MGVIRVATLVVLLVACDKGKVEPAKGSAQPTPAPLPVPDPQPVPIAPDAVFIRACNDTGKPITDLTYHHPPLAEGAVAAHECTPWRETKRAYNYTSVELTLAGEKKSIHPIDFVGETPLDAGYWSYHLTFENNSMNVRARKDPEGTIGTNKSSGVMLSVRACNDTGKDIAALDLWGQLPDPNRVLKKGACEPYRDVDRAFETPSLSFTVDAKQFTYRPTDDTPVKSLFPGLWTYHITIVDETKRTAKVALEKGNDDEPPPEDKAW